MIEREVSDGVLVSYNEDRKAGVPLVMTRDFRDGMRYAAKLIREYEPEHNKLYRERLAQHIEEKAK